MTDVDRKTKNIVVRCLRPYKGYGLPRESLTNCFLFVKYLLRNFKKEYRLRHSVLILLTGWHGQYIFYCVKYF